MKKVGLVLGIVLLLVLGAKAQVALNEKGFYCNKNGSYFTGALQLDENGERSVLEIKEGQAQGAANYFYASGKLMETGFFENGLKSGKWLRYNENGTTVALALFNVGKKNGTWICWDDKGNKTFEMHYTNGDKTGTWFNWDSSGQLLSSKDFGNGN